MKHVNTKKQPIKKRAMQPKHLLVPLLAILLAVLTLLGALVGLNAYRNSGKSIHDTVVLKSEHFTLNLAMYSYYFRSMDKGADKELVAMALTEQLALYEAAIKEGMTLSEERQSALNAQLDALKEAAEKKEQSMDEFLALQYGRGVKLADVAALLEMTALAAEKNEQMWQSISVQQGEIEQYCKDNSEQFLYCDYLTYVFSVPLNSTMSTSEKEQMVSLYESYAKKLAECTTVEAFKDMVLAFEEGFMKEEDEDAVLSDEDKNDIRNSVVMERASYSAYLNSDAVVKELNEWLYDGKRQVGDYLVYPYKNLEKNAASFGVYYMTRPLYTNTDPTQTIYDISLSFENYTKAAAEANVKKALAKYQQSPTEETLKALAAEYGGGLRQYVSCTTSLHTELYAFLTEVRKAGDTLVYEDTNGWHLIVYKEEGIPECYAQAKNVLESKAYEEMMQTYREAHAVAVTPASYAELPALRYGWLIF